MSITLEINEFIKVFSSQFENTDQNEFTKDTVFRSIEEWDSLVALSLIAMADEVYNVKLSGEEIINSLTVEDLFYKIKSKLEN
jgi:acyl carrier protein